MWSPAIKAYVLHNSYLENKNGKLILGFILSVVLLLAVLGRYSLDFNLLMSTYSWMWYSSLGSVATFLILSFLGRKKSIPWLYLGTVLFVALQAAFVAAFANNVSPFMLVTVGYVEEFVKILPALLMVIFVPNVIKTKKDAMIFGALGGVGFNIIEIALYIAKAMAGGDTLMEAIYMHSTRLAIMGFGNHIIWSMFVGLGLGMTIESDRKGIRKWMPFILIYLLIATVHSLFDLGLSTVGILVPFIILSLITGNRLENKGISAAETKQPGLLRDSMILEHFFFNIVFIVIIIKQLWKSTEAEQDIYRKQLMDESSDVISKEEKELLQKEGKWFMRRYANYSKKLSKKIVRLQNLLAMQKETLNKEGKSPSQDKAIELLRKEIIALKEAA